MASRTSGRSHSLNQQEMIHLGCRYRIFCPQQTTSPLPAPLRPLPPASPRCPRAGCQLGAGRGTRTEPPGPPQAAPGPAEGSGASPGPAPTMAAAPQPPVPGNGREGNGRGLRRERPGLQAGTGRALRGTGRAGGRGVRGLEPGDTPLVPYGAGNAGSGGV